MRVFCGSGLAALLLASCDSPGEPECCSLRIVVPDSVLLGGSATITAAFEPASDTSVLTREVSWSISPSDAAELTISGPQEVVVKGLRVGNAAITASSRRLSATATLRIAPVPPLVARKVAGGHAWQFIDAGLWHSCALDLSGFAYCWGDNTHGELGNGGTTSSSVPVPVTGGRQFASISVGSYHTCALTAQGEAFCWGRNHFAQLGRGASTLVAEPTPTLVNGGLTFASLTLGQDHTCGLTPENAAYCWGVAERSESGPARSGTCHADAIAQFSTWHCNPTPQPVSATQPFTALSASTSGVCGLTASASIYCWGASGQGALPSGTCNKSAHAGPPSFPCNIVPVQVVVPGTPTMLTAYGEGCARSGGSWYCWANSAPALISVSDVAYYEPGGCMLKSNGAALCWGGPLIGQIGVNADVTTPVPVTGASGPFTLVRRGTIHACGLTQSGEAFCWGSNSQGQLGDGASP